MSSRFFISVCLACAVALTCVTPIVMSRSVARRVRVAVLDFNETDAGARASEATAAALSGGASAERATRQEGAASVKEIELIDRALGNAAARGFGYKGSLNMTLDEARDLGAAIDCDFFITGDAQTIRRSNSSTPVYFEAYASIFIVSARTGRLIMWDRPSFEASTPGAAEAALLAEVDRRARARYRPAMLEAWDQEDARRATARAVDEDDPLDLSQDEAETPTGIRTPLPYRRLRPPYPDTAARAEAEATVDVKLDIDAEGEVGHIEVVRWAGFGLDEAVVDTVRQMHFRPAMRDNKPVPVRVLLRYNFRRPPKS